MTYRVEELLTETGACPYAEWFDSPDAPHGGKGDCRQGAHGGGQFIEHRMVLGHWLDREQRLVTLLDSVFNLSSQEAADVLDISAAAYRQRLARTRAVLDPFVKRTCGLANSEAACRCERRLPAIKHLRAQEPAGTKPATVIAIHRAELAEAERQFDQLLHLSDAAALLRSHPGYRAPESMIGAIRAVLRSAGYWDGEGGRSLQ